MGISKNVLIGILLLSGFLLPNMGYAQPGEVEILTQIFAPELLVQKHEVPPTEPRCGVEVAAMVAEHWQHLSPELRQHIPDEYRPVEFQTDPNRSNQGTEVCDAFWDSEHFRIHYSTDPDHQPPGYPDLQAVYDLAAHLETAYVHHRDVSGMGVALTDGEAGGGMDLYDCFFYDLEWDILGRAWGFIRQETDCLDTYAGRISMNTDLSPLDFDSQLRLTSEHEYFHLLQYAHNSFQPSWIKESTARNSEFHVWPEIARPRGIVSWMTQPYLPLWSVKDMHEYAPHMWFYLEDHYGDDYVTQMWDGICQGRAEDYLIADLSARGTSIDDMLIDFSIWNYFTGNRDDGQHYDSDSHLTAVYYQASHWNYPVLPRSLYPQKIAQPTGSNYVRFDGPATRNNLRLVVDGHPDLTPFRAVTVLAVNDWGHQAWTMTPDNNGDVNFTVPDWGLYDHVALVVTNLWDAPGDSVQLHFTYAAEAVDLAPSTDEFARLVSSSPNPFSDVTRVAYFVPQGGTQTTIRVYDLRGRLVQTLLDEAAFAGSHQVVWDGNDQQGQRAPTGMYLMQMESGGYQDVRKVMFVR